MYIKRSFTAGIFLVLLFFGWPTYLIGQKNENQQLVSNILDKAQHAYGPNEIIENGRIYIPIHPRANGDPYFLDSDWINGMVVIKGDKFSNLNVKYNVNLEELILKKEKENQESHIPIVLNYNFIDSFELEGHHFINLSVMPFGDELAGFAELIYQGEIIFLIKHTKEFLNRYSQSNPYGAYSKLNSTYYIYETETLTRLGTKKSFLNYFEPIRKEIKKFMRQNRIKYKKASHIQLYELIKYCDELSHN